uniref:Aspartyl/asparaginyl beta-hydroxylase n=1 Tax=Canis lupus dingo TaxID=286419 RepID=A0A8C0KTN3_CANLU
MMSLFLSPASSGPGGSCKGGGLITKHGGHKNGRKGGLSGSSFFTWFMVIALLGVWTSVAVVWFDLVDYEEVLGKNFGKLGVYDADGDGDFDVDDAKVLLGLKERSASKPTVPPEEAEPYPWLEEQVIEDSGLCYLPWQLLTVLQGWGWEEMSQECACSCSGRFLITCTSLFLDKKIQNKNLFFLSVKKKKPKLLNKFDKTIKAELDAAEKLRKRGKIEEALSAFQELVHKYPQSPRARYGKAQCEDDLAEKRRSNEVLRGAIETYQEVASLPNVPTDLLKLTLKRRSDRQQFLGHMRGSLITLQKLVQLFPDDMSLKNDLGVGYLLIGDNNNAQKVYEEVLNVTPNDGFAKVHYGFILKAQNKIAESIPYLKEGIESGDPGTDDGRFYFHLGDAMQRVGNKEAYKWYELGHKRGHFASVWQRSLYNVHGLKAQPWWTPKETGYTELVKSLERNWKLIRDEGLAVMDKAKGLFLPEDENLREKGDWSQFTLWQQGRKNENACKGAPKTCSLLDKFPETTGCRRGQIKYSIMHPGTHVWPHTGPTNCRLRMHLGLVIPKEGCKIRCANETKTWEEGKVLIFDDSFEHEVWQDATSFRLIFIVDVWHPELTPQQRHSLPAI